MSKTETISQTVKMPGAKSHMQHMGEGHHGWVRRISQLPRDYVQTTGHDKWEDGLFCPLTYGGVPGMTEFITANMLNRLIWMITQIPVLEHSPNIDDKLIQA